MCHRKWYSSYAGTIGGAVPLPEKDTENNVRWSYDVIVLKTDAPYIATWKHAASILKCDHSFKPGFKNACFCSPKTLDPA